MEQQTDNSDVSRDPSPQPPPSSSSETDPSLSTSQDTDSSSGRVIIPFQRASIYYNRVRQVPTFHCQLCKRSFVTHVLFENHKKFHEEDPLQQSHPFGLPLQSSAPINPGIRFATRRSEEKQKGSSVECELIHFGRLFIFDSHTSHQANNKNDSASKKYGFVCRFCPCGPNFDKEADFALHNRRVHPITKGENDNEEKVPLQHCDFCSVAPDLIERIQIGIPRPPLLTRRENWWHHNPFCTLHSKNPYLCPAKYTIPLENNTLAHTVPESGDDAASELLFNEQGTTNISNLQDEEATENSQSVNDARRDVEDENKDNMDALVLVKVARKRRVLFKGVEMFKCVSSADSSQEFWQCGACNFSLPTSKTHERMGHMAPLKQLKGHVSSSHQPRVTKVLKRLGSRKCEKNSVCKICGCPLSINRRHNFLLHKFSHMSDAERKAALARGEGGTIKRLLSSKLWNRREIKTRINKETFRKSEDFSGEVSACPTSSEKGVESKNTKEFACPHCQQKFTRKSHSIIHFRSCLKMWKELPEVESMDRRQNASQIFSSFKDVIAKVMRRPAK